MNNPGLDNSIEQILANLSARWNNLPSKTLLPAFSLLTAGKPVPIEKFAEVSGKTVAELEADLKNAPIEWNEKKELINIFGFKLAPTFHRLNFGGVITYSCCTLWQFFIPLLAGKHAIADSVDPISRKIITFESDPSGLIYIEPKTSTMTLINSPLEKLNENIGANFCRHVRIFENSKTASEWIAEDPNRFQVDLKTVDKTAKKLSKEIWFKETV